MHRKNITEKFAMYTESQVHDGFENGRVFIGGIVIEKYNGTACDDWNVTGINFYEIDPNTICQCTGLKDKNGKLIWENDIVKHYNDGAHPENYCTGTVLWDENYAEFYRTSNEYGLSKPRINRDCIYEVIGNKFDNPELLEV